MNSSPCPTKPQCAHCRTKPVNRPAGLCWSCYHTPAVRERYRKRWPRGFGIDNREPPLPPTPTTARPGTPEKIAVMRARASAGVAIFHPGDG